MTKSTLLRKMREKYTYEGVNLCNAIITQATGAHIGKGYSDLTGKYTRDEALQILLEVQGRDNGTNGFCWHYECNELFAKHRNAIIAWFKDYAENLGYNSITELLVDMQKAEKYDLAEELLRIDTNGWYKDANSTIALIVRQLMYEVAIDLQEFTSEFKLAG